jgi:double-stranded uracil-DNA glycosylase
LEKSHKPTRTEIELAHGKKVSDIIAPALKVLFCGINPGLYSGATGHHFARPGNRFWPVLYHAGFTPRILNPWEETELLEFGLGITNVVGRATAAAAELTAQEMQEGGRRLKEKIIKYQPRCLAVLGIGAYRHAFQRKDISVGRQPEGIGSTEVWVLPNPSGLNAHYQMEDLARLFGEMKAALDARYT